MPNVFEDGLDATARNSIAADEKIRGWQKKLNKGDCFYYYSSKRGIVVWGEVLENQNDPLLHGYRTCRCFSATHPEGEVGEVHISVIHSPIPRAFLEKARSAGWPHDEVTFTRFALALHAEHQLN